MEDSAETVVLPGAFSGECRQIKIKCVRRILEMTDGRAEWQASCRGIWRVRGAFSGSRAAAPPSRVDACVGSYWVLSDAKTGRFGSKAALDLRKKFERRRTE